MSSLSALALLIGGVALVIAGADVFFRALLAVAARLRLPAFVVTVVLSGFELENLAAGIAANAKDLPGAAAGTFLGGTTFLAAGIAGLGALIAPMQTRLPLPALAWMRPPPFRSSCSPSTARSAVSKADCSSSGSPLALTGLARSGRSLLEAERKQPPRRPLLLLAAGLGVLTLGGELLGEGIRAAVSRLGLSATLLGSTAVAASVEAEELARVALPARRGRSDVALANVLGTVVHFIAFNAAVIALVQPLPLDDATLHLHLPAAVVATGALCALLALRGLGRPEGGLLARPLPRLPKRRSRGRMRGRPAGGARDRPARRRQGSRDASGCVVAKQFTFHGTMLASCRAEASGGIRGRSPRPRPVNKRTSA